MNQKGRAAWEWVVIVAIVAAAVVMLAAGYNQQQKVEKQKDLKYQLETLRTAEILFRTINKKNPESLKQLVEGTFTMPEETTPHKYVEQNLALKDGKIIDPFGNAYTYDTQKGWIKSSTPGYELW